MPSGSAALFWPALVAATAVGAGSSLLATEVLRGRLQARVASAVVGPARYAVGAGESETVRYPRHGPYDERLGYVRLPGFVGSLRGGGAVVEAQAGWSPGLTRLSELGLHPPYHEKAQAGLRLTDRSGRLLYEAVGPAPSFARYRAVPWVVAASLLFLENRELLETSRPYRNPAVEWTRLGWAVVQAGVAKLIPGHGVPGASTLATQMEKYRHSPGGQTSSAAEKLIQMLSATARIYLDGPETEDARRRILVDYLDTLPLGSALGYGEVLGLGSGLHAMFGADLGEVSALLVDAHLVREGDARMAERGVAFRQVVALLLGLRRPSHLLRDDRPGLERLIDRTLERFAARGLIPAPLLRAALAQRLVFLERAQAPRPFESAPKVAQLVRVRLGRELGLHGLYDLDRLDLAVETTFDLDAQRAATELLRAVRSPSGDLAAGLSARRLLAGSDPGPVHYSFALYERSGGRNVARVHTDTFDGPFDLNDGMKLELGSTAKLRTLVSYLEVIAEIDGRLPAESNSATPQPAAADQLTRWVVGWRAEHPDAGLPALLEAALDRRYPANPRERFRVAGGSERYRNLGRADDRRKLTVRDAFRRSVNLPFVRMLRDVIEHLVESDPASAALAADPGDPRRRALLERYAERDGRRLQRRFFARLRGAAGGRTADALAGPLHGDAGRLAALLRYVRPAATPSDLLLFLARHMDALPPAGDVVALYRRHAPGAADPLADLAFRLRLHPLALVTASWLEAHPGGGLADLLDETAADRQAVAAGVTLGDRKQAQDSRIQALLEEDAFDALRERWARLGYPFARLVPSYGTALGASGDRPIALIALLGILSADGERFPLEHRTRLRFAVGSPYETVLRQPPSPGDLVLSPAVARAARSVMRSVVSDGTAASAKNVFGAGLLTLAAKTGTGDNRSRRFDRRGRLLSDEVRSRTATFVFLVGERWFGAVTAHVSGRAAEDYTFTSALPAHLLKLLAPKVLPAFGPPKGH